MFTIGHSAHGHLKNDKRLHYVFQNLQHECIAFFKMQHECIAFFKTQCERIALFKTQPVRIAFFKMQHEHKKSHATVPLEDWTPADPNSTLSRIPWMGSHFSDVYTLSNFLPFFKATNIKKIFKIYI